MKLKQLIQKIAARHGETFSDLDQLETYCDRFPELLLKVDSLQTAFEVSNYEMEEIYDEAYWHYQNEQYLEASTTFRWLVLLNPFYGKYWMGLAANLQLLEKYEKALHAYALVTLLEEENPYPHFHAFACYYALNDYEEAKKALHSAHSLVMKNQHDYRELKREIEGLLTPQSRFFKTGLGEPCNSVSKSKTYEESQSHL